VSRGQSLIELAVCAPVITLLTLGAVASVQLVDARTGLQAATQAAAAEAARAPDASTATTAAQARFASMVAGYPLSDAQLSIVMGTFSRTDEVVAIASGQVDISWAALIFPRRLTIQCRVSVPIESWRSRRVLL
jgi:Flp pilus assembly protein TadG